MRHPLCDCSTGGGLVHDPECAYWDAAHADGPAAQAAAEDGYPSLRAAIRHPSHAGTRAHFRANPLPRQQNRRAS